MTHYTPTMNIRCRLAAWRERRRIERAMRTYRRIVLRQINNRDQW